MWKRALGSHGDEQAQNPLGRSERLSCWVWWLLFGFFVSFNLQCQQSQNLEKHTRQEEPAGKWPGTVVGTTLKMNLFIVCRAVAADRYPFVVISWCNAEDPSEEWHFVCERRTQENSHFRPRVWIFLCQEYLLIWSLSWRKIVSQDLTFHQTLEIGCEARWEDFKRASENPDGLPDTGFLYGLTSIPKKGRTLVPMQELCHKKKKQQERQRHYKPTKETKYRVTSLDLYYRGTKNGFLNVQFWLNLIYTLSILFPLGNAMPSEHTVFSH